MRSNVYACFSKQSEGFAWVGQSLLQKREWASGKERQAESYDGPMPSMPLPRLCLGGPMLVTKEGVSEWEGETSRKLRWPNAFYIFLIGAELAVLFVCFCHDRSASRASSSDEKSGSCNINSRGHKTCRLSVLFFNLSTHEAHNIHAAQFEKKKKKKAQPTQKWTAIVSFSEQVAIIQKVLETRPHQQTSF